MILYTMGYEGLEIETFFEQLNFYKVNLIIDVRELPLSRKFGFSKKKLDEISFRNNIRYIHLPKLGCPRDIRHNYKIDGDWQEYSKRFLYYLDSQNEEILNLANIVQSDRCCLVCFERDFHYCHRRYVANAVAQTIGSILTINHIRPDLKVKAAYPPFLADRPIQ